MNNIYLKNNLSIIQKITLSGLFIALITILQKVIAINYIAVVPFVRISFGGCALLIFASVFLGPWYGLLIGAASDILGYFIFDPKTMGFFPQITAIYTLMGFISYFFFILVRFIKNKKMMICVEYGVFAAFLIAITLFITLNDSISLYSSTYSIELWQKITIPVVLFVLFSLLVVLNFFMDRYFKSKEDSRIYFNVYQISFACFLIEMLVMVMFGTLMKGLAFGLETYPAILIAQLLVAFFNIPLNTFLISYIMRLTKRFYQCPNEVSK